jgi:hypothetical protein
MPEFQGGDDEAVLRQGLVEALGPRQVAIVPGAAVQVDNRWKGAIALRLVEARDQPPVAMTQIFDIFGGNFVSGRHIRSLPGLLCCGASRIATVAAPIPKPGTQPTRYATSVKGRSPAGSEAVAWASRWLWKASGIQFAG